MGLAPTSGTRSGCARVSTTCEASGFGVFIETQVEPLTIHATFEEAAGALERLTSELLVRPGWQLVRSDGRTMVFQYVGSGWPIGWDSKGRPIVNR